MKKHLLSVALAAIAPLAMARTALVYDVIKYKPDAGSETVLTTSVCNAGIDYKSILVENSYLNYGIDLKIGNQDIRYCTFSKYVYLNMDAQFSRQYGQTVYNRKCEGSNGKRYLYKNTDLSVSPASQEPSIGFSSSSGPLPDIETCCLKGRWDTTISSSVWQECYTNWECTLTYEGQYDGKKSTQPFTNTTAFTLKPVEKMFNRTGYTFNCWKDAEDKEYRDEARIDNPPDNDLTLKAEWEPVQVKINLDAQDGSCSLSYIKLAFNEKYAGLPTPEPPADVKVTFMGWYTAQSGGMLVDKDVTITTAVEHTLYARWENVKVTLTLKPDEKSSQSEWTFLYDVVWNKKLPVVTNLPTKAGYSFVGYWNADTKYYDENGCPLVEYSPFDSSTVLLAHWTNNVYRLTLNFNVGDGGQSSVLVEYDKQIPVITIPRRDGYTFAGYWSEPSDSATQYIAPEGSGNAKWNKPNDAELFARWSEGKYYLQYHSNPPKDAEEIENVSKVYGPYTYAGTGYFASVNDLGFAYTEYQFVGWSTNKNDMVAMYEDGAQFSRLCAEVGKTLDLYAIWKLNPVFTLELDANGGRIDGQSKKSVQCTQGEAYADLSVPTRNGYDFAGWWTEKGTTNVVCAGEQRRTGMIADRAKTLYARWKVAKGAAAKVNGTFKLINVNSSFAASGQAGDTREVVCTVGQEVGELPQVYCNDDWSFFGWYTAPSGGVQVTERTIVEGEFTAYARCSMKRLNKWTGVSEVAFVEGEPGDWVEAQKKLISPYETGLMPSSKKYSDASASSILNMLLPGNASLSFKYKSTGAADQHIRLAKDGGKFEVVDSGIVDEWKDIELTCSFVTLKYNGSSDKMAGTVKLVDFVFAVNSSRVIDNWDLFSVASSKDSFSLAGVSGWTVTDKVKAEGTNGLVAEKVPDARFTELSFKTNQPGTVTFKWRTSCENGYYDKDGNYQYADYLELRLDGVSIAKLEGAQDGFSDYTIDVPANCEISWRYVKDADGSAGDDAAWVDSFTFTPNGYQVIFKSEDESFVSGYPRGRVYRLPSPEDLGFSAPVGHPRFAGWLSDKGRRYDDGVLVFGMAEDGGAVELTAIWE